MVAISGWFQKNKMSSYSIPEENIFIEKTEKYFEELITKYQYTVADRKTQKHSALLVYINETIHRKIEISNQTDYTDYGFSIFLFNTQNHESNIVVNVPFEKQDKECEFLRRSSEFVFTNLQELIAGSKWEKYTQISMQK